ncbi:MAG: DoxX protein [Chloroflexota bacterium]
MSGRLFSRIAAYGMPLGALVALVPSYASAHEKWFYDSAPHPADFLASVGFPGFIGVACAGVLAAVVAWMSRTRGGRDFIPGPEALGATPERRAGFYSVVPLILGFHVGVPLIVFGIRGELFSPNNHLAGVPMYWVGVTEIGIGVCLLYGVLARVAGTMLAALWVIGILVQGLETMLENLYYLGFAFFFAFNGRGPYSIDRILMPRLEPPDHLAVKAMSGLRICTGLALVVVSFTEKLANHNLSVAFLEEFRLNFSPWVGLPVSDEVFIVGAGATELLIGLCVVFGFFPRVIIFTTWLFINLTLTIFNWIELLGHFPIYGVMAVFLVWSSSPEDARLWLRGVFGRDDAREAAPAAVLAAERSPILIPN